MMPRTRAAVNGLAVTLELVAPQIVDWHAILRRRARVDTYVVRFGAKGWARLIL